MTRATLAALFCALGALAWPSAPAQAQEWSPSVNLSQISGGTSSASTPQVATGADGTTAVVWTVDQRLLARVRPPGGTFGSTVAIAEPRTSTVPRDNEALVRDPTVAVDRDGNVVVAWLQWYRPAGTNTYTWELLYRSRQADDQPGGGSWLGRLHLDTKVGPDASPTLMANRHGLMTALWLRQASGESVVMFRVRRRGVVNFTETDMLVRANAVGQSATKPVLDLGSGFPLEAVVAWERPNLSPTRVEAAVLSAGEAAFSPSATVSDSWLDSRNPEVDMGEDGRATVVWESQSAGNPKRIAAAFQRSNGSFTAPAFATFTTDVEASSPSIDSGPDGRRTLAWTRTESAQNSFRERIQTRDWTPGPGDDGTWGPFTYLTPDSGWANSPVVVTDRFNATTIAWKRTSETAITKLAQARTRLPTGDFGETTNVSSSYLETGTPRLAVGFANGAVTATWLATSTVANGQFVNFNVETAMLTPRKFALTTAGSGNGQGRISSSPSGIDCGSECESQFDAGTLINLTATPDPGSAFAGWGGDCPGRRPSCLVEMDEARTVTADFEPARVLTATKTGDGTGWVASDVPGIRCGETCASGFVLGETVTLTATPSPNHIFTGWSGDCAGQDFTCLVEMDEARQVNASFEPSSGLIVTRTGTGGGSVVSNPSGIDCGISCRKDFLRGSTVTLEARPAVDSRFKGWNGDCSGQSLTCEVTMSQARNVSADFEPTATLTVAKEGSGDGNISSSPEGLDCVPDCDETVVRGTVITLTASPAAGSAFAGWGGDCSGRSFSCSVTMSEARNVTATFEHGHPLGVTRIGGGAGVVNSDPAGIQCGVVCSRVFVENEMVTLTASPSPGTLFAGWGGACDGASLTCQLTIGQARSVTAIFELRTPLNVSRTGIGRGAVISNPSRIECGSTCQADYPQGTIVTLTAVPEAGSMLTAWSGACSGRHLTCEVTMSQARSVSADFAFSAPIAVEKNGSGAGKVVSAPAGIDCGSTCERQFLRDTIVNLTATADPGNTFLGWGGDCTGDETTCRVTANKARNVTATFQPGLQLTVNRTGSGAGTIRSDVGGISCGENCRVIYAPDSPVTLTASPASGSRFVDWSGDCAGESVTCQVTMDEAREVTARYAKVYNLQTAVLSSSGSGDIKIEPAGIDCGSSCDTSFDQGTAVELTANPHPGNYLRSWGGSCSGRSTRCSFEMDRARAVTASFAPGFYLSVDSAGSGKVTSSPAGVDCGASCVAGFASGETVTLTAIPDPGYRLAGWHGHCSGQGVTCQVTLDEARNVTVAFEPIPSHQLRIKLAGNGLGKTTSTPAGIDCGRSCQSIYADGTRITLTATPEPGSRFDGWSGVCRGQSLTCQITLDQARQITATFTTIPETRVCPPRKLRLGRLQLDQKKGTATLDVTTGGPGTIFLKRTNTNQPDKTGITDSKATIRIRARGKASRQLQRTGKTTLRLTLTYQSPNMCRTATRTRHITLRKK